MRRRNTEHVAGILQQVLEELHIAGPIQQAHVIRAWSTVLGASINHVTDKIYFRQGGVLFVRIRSSVVKNELLMNKQRIIDRLNEDVGAEVVKDIIIQ